MIFIWSYTVVKYDLVYALEVYTQGCLTLDGTFHGSACTLDWLILVYIFIQIQILISEIEINISYFQYLDLNACTLSYFLDFIHFILIYAYFLIQANCKGSGGFRRKRDLLHEGTYNPDFVPHPNKYVSIGPILVKVEESLMELNASTSEDQCKLSLSVCVWFFAHRFLSFASTCYCRWHKNDDTRNIIDIHISCIGNNHSCNSAKKECAIEREAKEYGKWNPPTAINFITFYDRSFLVWYIFEQGSICCLWALDFTIERIRNTIISETLVKRQTTFLICMLLLSHCNSLVPSSELTLSLVFQ